MKSTVNKEKTKEFNQFCRQIMKLSEEVEKEVMEGVNDEVDGQTLQNRMSTLKKQSSKKSVQQILLAEKHPILMRARPQSAQNHTMYTTLKRHRRLHAQQAQESYKNFRSSASSSRSPQRSQNKLV